MEHDYHRAGSSIRLEPLEEKDIEALREMRNANSAYFVDSALITEEQQREWFNRYQQDPTDIMFSAFLNEAVDGKPVGFVSLYHMNSDKRCAEFGRLMVDSSVRGRGIGEDIVRTTLSIGFDGLGLDTIQLEVWKDNHSAYSLYRRCGFVETGAVQHGERVSIIMVFKKDVR